MDNVNKLLYMVFSALVFCLAVALVFYEAFLYRGALNNTREMLKEDKMYQQYFPQNKETISYAELIATLLQTLEHDVEIDGLMIHAETHQTGDIIEYDIEVRDYMKSYRYDTSGNITMVVYTGING